MEWNGMEWNGMGWDGMEWNGMECNGLNLPCAEEIALEYCFLSVRYRVTRTSGEQPVVKIENRGAL